MTTIKHQKYDLRSVVVMNHSYVPTLGIILLKLKHSILLFKQIRVQKPPGLLQSIYSIC